MKDLSIYVHIPFCKHKCKYCDFCSFFASESEQKEYFSYLEKEIISKAKRLENYKVKSIYFGGGTPSFVNEEYIEKIMKCIFNHFSIDINAENTIECNPCSVSREKLLSYKNAGFNRISFGVQSFENKVLSSSGRLHDRVMAENSINLAKEVGFQKISCDLMIGLPFQTKKMILRDIKRLDELGIKHISLYMLQLEEGTLLYDEVKSGSARVFDEDSLADCYNEAVTLLNKLGFMQYEVSNFAKDEEFSQHNMAYWRRKEYVGFGLSAHSFLNGKRIANSKNLKEYFSRKGQTVEKLSKEEVTTEIIMLGLRYFEGFSLSRVKKLGKDIEKDKDFLELVKKGVLIVDKDNVKLNPKYYCVNNDVIVKLI